MTVADSEDFYTTSEMTARLDLVRHLIENSELVPLVRGPAGIGKSVMASRLQQLAPDNWVVCHFAADSMMQPERLLSHIARCNGLPDAQHENLARLEDRYTQLRKRGSTPVLLVDDAQALPPTSLITLLRLYERQVGGAPLVSLVLFANEQIDMLLSTPQLQVMTPQAIQVIDLPPLTREEATGFMRYLLNAEGLGDRFFLDEAKLNRIYRDTAGIPGLMATAVLAAVGEDETPARPTGQSIIKPLLVYGLPLLAVILLILVFQRAINHLFESPPDNQPVASEETVRIPAQVGRGQIEEEKSIASVVEAPINSPISEPIPKSAGVPAAIPPITDSEPVGSSPAVAVLEESASLLDARSEGTESNSGGASGVSESLSLEVQDAKPVVETPVASQVIAKTDEVAAPEPPAVKVESQQPAAAKVEKQQPPAREALSISTPAPAAVKTPPMGGNSQASSVDSLVKTHEWLSAQPLGSYTIQLLAVENLESIRPVIVRHGIAEKAFSVETLRHGKPWFPLLWGVFPDRPAALAALKQLPPSLQKEGAWARPLASLQQ
jgi:DamX protein